MTACTVLHFPCLLSVILTGLVLSKAGIMNKEQKYLLDRIWRGDDGKASGRRAHKQLTGAELNEEIALISSALNDMIDLCNSSYTTPLGKYS